MIAIEEQANYLSISIVGTFSVSDYKTFESHALTHLTTGKALHILFDLTAMDGYTLDMLWEEVRFTRAHAHDFEQIAVIATDDWINWAAWITQLFTDAEVQIFNTYAEAESWLATSAIEE